MGEANVGTKGALEGCPDTVSIGGVKKILIIAGPNGAGKTTFAEEFLPNEAECPEFVNADLIAAGLSPFQPEKVAFAAGRLMLQRINDLVAAEKSFALETTLATRIYVRLIPQWRKAGYRLQLSFLKLPNPDIAIRRVDQRVSLGGHAIPHETIRRRFERGWKNLHSDYLKLVDEWSIYDASEIPPVLIETGKHRPPQTLMEDPAEYRADDDSSSATPPAQRPVVPPLDETDCIGALAALKRASEKAIKRALDAGLEPVVRRAGDGQAKAKENP